MGGESGEASVKRKTGHGKSLPKARQEVFGGMENQGAATAATRSRKARAKLRAGLEAKRKTKRLAARDKREAVIIKEREELARIRAKSPYNRDGTKKKGKK